jgi:hypothetical protein
VKWIQLAGLVILFKSSVVFSQLNNPAFFERKKVIDSLVLAIDKTQPMLVQRVTGVDSLFNAYKGVIYYTSDVTNPDKISYDFELDSLGSKTFYYKDGLIKIVDKGMPLYYAGGILVKGNGFVTDPVSTKNLLYFDKVMRNLFLQLFEKK